MHSLRTERHSAPPRDLMEAIVGSLEDAIMSLNGEGVITSWNASAERLLGYSKSKILGRHVSLLMTESHQSEIRRILDSVLGGDDVQAYETILVTKNGVLFPAYFNTAVIRDEAGSIVGISVVVREAKGNRFTRTAPNVKELAQMKHDILTPMGTIKGLSKILEMSHSLSPREREIIGTLKESADDLHRIIENVFEVVQPPSPDAQRIEDGTEKDVCFVSGENKAVAGISRILLVDDYPANVLMIKSSLENLGYECDTARSGLEALEKLSASSYALIIMDIQMPEMDGLDTTRRIRLREQERGLSPTPILAASANASEEDRIVCLRAGMNGCFSKRFELEELDEILQRFITRPHPGATAGKGG